MLNNNEDDEVIQREDEEQQQTTPSIIPTVQISEQFYRTVLPFKPGAARGLIVNNISNRLDINVFETGLLRLSQQPFPTDDYFYQEGQYITAEDINTWTQRQNDEGKGLNPPLSGEGNLEQQNNQNPEYLSHILEQNFLTKNENDEYQLGGISIGLSLNSVHYFNQEDGFPRQTDIPRETVLAKGKEMANTILQELRTREGLAEVPILIGIFEESPRNTVQPGTFISSGIAESGEASIGDWSGVNSQYVVFPSNEATENHYSDADKMTMFQEDIAMYFPNYVGVIGRGLYRGDELQKMMIDIPITFYGKAETIGFTQYVAGLVEEYFPKYVEVEVNITTLDKPQSLIVRESKEEPFVYIYE